MKIYSKSNDSLKLQIYADFNHDGMIDEQRSSTDSVEQFAVVMPVPGIACRSSVEIEQWQLMGGISPLDVGVFKVWLNESAPKGSILVIGVDDDSRGRVHLFQLCQTQWKFFGSEGVWRFPWKAGCKEFILSLIADSLAQTATDGACRWSGELILTAAVVGKNKKEIVSDMARFRVAPFLMASSLDPVEEVLVIDNDGTAGFVEALRCLVPQTGARLRALQFKKCDIWVQDTVEIGRICVPSAKGVRQAVAVLAGIRAKHHGIETGTLDRSIREYFNSLDAIVVDAAESRAGTRWIDWYGNLEVSPPVKAKNGRGFPFGRILTGVQNGLGMHPDVLAFLEAQRYQAPPLVIDTSWLGIGHVDEVVNFTPAHDRQGFRVLIPSITLARSILESAASGGLKHQAVFANHSGETTVIELLDEVADSEQNCQIQDILLETRAILREGLGVEDDDFVEIPALFRNGRAVIPNCVNCLICNWHAVLPDPLGPRVNGEDAFAAPIKRALNRLGVKTHFVDVWAPYHSGAGEIHCGTNAIRSIRRPEWWKVDS